MTVSYCVAILQDYLRSKLIPVAAQSKLWVNGRSLAGIADSNPTGRMDVCVLWVLCVVK